MKKKILTLLVTLVICLSGAFTLAGCNAGEGGEASSQIKAMYTLAVDNGYTGTYEEWLQSIKGEKGDNGKSAYEIAKENGFVGTYEEWLQSIKGEKGDNGKSAYEIAKENGFVGTEKEWLESLCSASNLNYFDIFKVAERKLLFNIGGVRDNVTVTYTSSQESGSYLATETTETYNYCRYNENLYAYEFDNQTSGKYLLRYDKIVDEVVGNIAKDYKLREYTKDSEGTEEVTDKERTLGNLAQDPVIFPAMMTENYSIKQDNSFAIGEVLGNGNYKITIVSSSTMGDGSLLVLMEVEITKDYKFVSYNYNFLGCSEESSDHDGGYSMLSGQWSFDYGNVDVDDIKQKISKADQLATQLVNN